MFICLISLIPTFKVVFSRKVFVKKYLNGSVVIFASLLRSPALAQSNYAVPNGKTIYA